jgi:hypothetical protein
MKTLPLREIAHARSGDKGDTSNVGVIAYDEADYPILRDQVTVERVAALYGDLVRGEIVRYELPNIGALNFVLRQALACRVLLRSGDEWPALRLEIV